MYTNCQLLPPRVASIEMLPSDLELQLLERPDDTATWQVYADMLQERGDPRGDVIALGEKLRQGDDSVAALYAERCRAARWPRGAPFPVMHYRVRFEQMFEELRARPDISVRTALIEGPVLDDLARWKKVAGAAWPPGMTELYSELSGVDLEYKIEGGSLGGAIHIPALSLWDHGPLDGELWFDFTDDDNPLHRLRPIDRFVSEAYTVLYLRDPDRVAEVAYHYCGETLIPTRLSYREWLEMLFRSRGVFYWIKLAVEKRGRGTWVEDGIAQVAKRFPDFDPAAMSPTTDCEEVEL
jgi:uncharacterized protein (TIGR02996 family)